MLYMTNEEFNTFKDDIKIGLKEVFPIANGKVKITPTGLVYYDLAGITYLVEDGQGWDLGSIFTLMTESELDKKYDEIILSIGDETRGDLFLNEDGILIFDDGLTWLVEKDAWGNTWEIGEQIHQF